MTHIKKFVMTEVLRYQKRFKLYNPPFKYIVLIPLVQSYCVCIAPFDMQIWSVVFEGDYEKCINVMYFFKKLGYKILE